MGKSTHKVRLARWKQLIKQWLAEHDINDKAYCYWLRKVWKNIYDQSVSSKTLPTILEEPKLAFAQLSDSYLKVHTILFPFKPVAVLKTAIATLAASNGILDQLLNQLFR